MVELNLSDAIALATADTDHVPARFLTRSAHGHRLEDGTLTTADLIPGYLAIDGLYLRLFIAARRFIDGQRQHLFWLERFGFYPAALPTRSDHPVPPRTSSPSRIDRPVARAALEPRSVGIVIGTRPEHIKLSILAQILGPAARIIHTSQHYDALMTDVVPEVRWRQDHQGLRVGGQHRGVQIGDAIAHLTQQWEHDPPRVIVVQGDTNTALAGALAANACGIPLVHVEAGLRSRDRRMPEEHNRVLIDHIADLCCAATPGNVSSLLAEGVPAQRVPLTGNPVVEAVTLTRRDHCQAQRLLGTLSGSPFVVATLHRPENVDDPERLAGVLHAFTGLDLPVLLPLHPRARRRITEFALGKALGRLHTCAPPACPAFVALMEQARLLISDSGGIREEATVIKKPLIQPTLPR